MSLKVRAPSDWLDRSTWLFVLLVLVMLLPAACVLWFLNEAVITQSAAARQRVLEAYRGQLRLVRSRIDGHWRAEAARLNSTAAPAQQFARLMLDGVSDGVVLLHPDGRVAYPNDAPANVDAAAIDRQLPTTEQLDDVAAKLNDYTTSWAAPRQSRLVNLLDNAIKYTPTDKQIVVRAYRDGETFVSFLVQDNGVGISVREHRRIFRRFYRVDQRLTQDTGGVGLGLSIVDLIAQGHRGSISVRSAPGAGSTFVLRLPALGQVAS